MFFLKQVSKFSIVILVFMTSYVACTPPPKDECTTDKDCQDKGSNYTCRLDKTKNIKVCQKKAVKNDCENDNDCKSKGADYKCQFDQSQNKKRCILNSTCPTTCHSNTDCWGCPDNKTFCVNNKCDKKQLPQCPATCQSDSDCTPCLDGKNFCNNGQCGKKVAQCPDTCTKDFDCVNCPDTRTTCNNGQCMKAPKCPSSCTVNVDCAFCSDSKNSCINGQCQVQQATCPASCSQDSDCSTCPDNRTSCINNNCKKKPICPSFCSQDSDCAACSDNKTSCINRSCEKKPVCPSSCSQDSDCTVCPDDRTSCIGNQCEKKPVCPSSCSQDSDCATCPDNKTSCINRSCEKKPTCPSSCSQDSDCATCPNNKTSCINNQCAQSPTCPSSCSQDADCTACPNGMTSCVKNKCSKPLPTCPSSCTQDSECTPCTNGMTACVKNKCSKPLPKCPVVCSKNSDCAPCTDGKTSCILNVCKKPPIKQCLASCSANIDCALCGTGYSCYKNVCQIPPSTRGAGYVCDPNATDPCLFNHYCISIKAENKAYCFQDCTKDRLICQKNTDGRTSCVEFAKTTSGQTISVCLKEAKANELCSYAGQSQSVCKSQIHPILYCNNQKKCIEIIIQKTVGDKCNKLGDKTQPIRICDRTLHLGCVNGLCQKNKIVKKYEKCGIPGTECDKNLICVTFSKNAANGYCLEKCDIKNPKCLNNATCSALMSGEGVCTPVGTLKEDAVCGGQLPDAAKLDPAKLCEASYLCIPFNNMDSRGICFKKVASCTATSCKTGRKCLSLQSNVGVCAKDCSTDPKLCSSPQTCLSIKTDKVCGLEPPIGTNEFGKICKDPLDHFGCKKDLLCVPTNNQNDGFCSQTCSTTKPCPDYLENGKTIKSKCITLQSTSLCVFPCDKTTEICPKGLQCRTLKSGSKICVVP